MGVTNSVVKWRSIDSAPRDGKPFVARFTEGIVTLAWFNTNQKLGSDPFWFCGIPGRYETAPNVQPNEWLPDEP